MSKELEEKPEECGIIDAKKKKKSFLSGKENERDLPCQIR